MFWPRIKSTRIGNKKRQSAYQLAMLCHVKLRKVRSYPIYTTVKLISWYSVQNAKPNFLVLVCNKGQ